MVNIGDIYKLVASVDIYQNTHYLILGENAGFNELTWDLLCVQDGWRGVAADAELINRDTYEKVA